MHKDKKNTQQRRPTGSDVAKLAGTSKSTVSRVFNGGVVAPEVKDRIIEAAKTLHYRPNPIARSMIMQRSYLIGVAITYLDNQLYPEFVQKLSDKFADAGFRLVLFITHGERKRDPTLEEIMNYSLDAVIFASSNRADVIAQGCIDAGIPTIMFNNISTERDIKCISTDDIAGALEIARLCLRIGHQQIGLITGIEDSSASKRRSAAFSKACEEANNIPVIQRCGYYTFEGAMQATRDILTHYPKTDAIFAINDHMALACLQVSEREFQRRPGKDISIIGFDNVAIGSWPGIELTSFAHPLDDIIDRMLSYILSALNGEPLDNQPEFISGELIIRQSTLPVTD
ncbi:LacI family transcriptional regulator [Aestuariibacter sp. GS-14]|uniref:LacI family DNA-binding transcriptional regulator n=1 Tax=Aestuariibacter sp. GS-14 TaxID=2590670 RepID=UPI001128B8CA|nr:LacI family DNA-binding transcriptional regulator [Aestuariibacter sp. GS-14]TPV60883.1 LacI family transcriptional regulator [Aestuariibacter sp. GS-14]